MVHLMVTLNERYLRPLTLMLYSLLQADAEEYTVYLCHRGLTPAQIARLEEDLDCPRCQLVPVEVKEQFLEGMPLGHYPPEMYDRLFAPRLLPEELDRVLYLDPDIIVLGPLGELYRMELGDSLMAAATHVREALRRLNQLRLGMSPQGLYINSGVMVMNLTRMRQLQRPQMVLEYLEQHRRHLWLPDQDLISGLYGDQILQLDSWKWNMTERLYAMQPGRRERVGISWVRENSVIIHYCGRGKPWKGRYLGSLDVFYKEAEAAFYRSGRCLPPLELEEH